VKRPSQHRSKKTACDSFDGSEYSYDEQYLDEQVLLYK
jgi:hypothetical protein